MYNPKDIQFVGKHDFDQASAEKFASLSINQETFSVNIFKWGLAASKKRMKPLKCVVRVQGHPSNFKAVIKASEDIVVSLDSGTYTGPKNVKVRSSN